MTEDYLLRLESLTTNENANVYFKAPGNKEAFKVAKELQRVLPILTKVTLRVQTDSHVGGTTWSKPLNPGDEKTGWRKT